MKKWLERLVGYFWLLLAIIIITTAILVQLGRQLSPMVDKLRPTISDQLSQHFDAEIDMQELNLTWQELQLGLIIRQLTISRQGNGTVLQVDHANLQLDILASLLQGQLIWQRVIFHDIYLHAEQNNKGLWNLAGFSRTEEDSTIDVPVLDPSDLFILSKQVDLRNANLVLDFRTGGKTTLSIPTITIENDNDFHRLQASIEVDDDEPIFYFVVEGEGDPRDRDTFSAKGFLQLKHFPISRLLEALPKKTVSEKENQQQLSSYVDLDLWIDFLKPNAFSIEGDFSLSDLQSIHDGKPTVIAKSIDSVFSGAIDLEGESSLSLKQVKIDNSNNITLPNVALNLSMDHIDIHIDHMNIAEWTDWFKEKPFLNDYTRGLLTTLAPEGVLKNIALSSKIDDWRNVKLRSNIVDTDIHAWNSAPALHGINGYLETTLTKGFVDLDSNNFRLFARSTFNREMKLAQTKGQISWHVRPEQNSLIVNSGLLHSDSEYGRINGAFYMDVPLEKHSRPDRFILQIGLQNARLEDYHFFLPQKVPDNLRTWLSSSINKDSGNVTAAGFIYHGELSSQWPGKPSIQLFVDIDQGDLIYDPQWPALTNITGQLIIDNDHVSANLSHARLYDATINEATIHWPATNADDIGDNLRTTRQLHIKGSVTGPATSALRLLRESPLRANVGATFDHWTADGRLDTDLTLALPLLDKEVAPAYDITLKFRDNTIELGDQGLSLANINGQLTLNSDTGFASSSIKSTLWDHPLTITIENQIQQEISHIVINGQGRTDITSVARWLDRPELLFARGETDFAIQMKIPLASKQKSVNDVKETGKKREDFSLTLESDLTGVAIDLPQPFAKKASNPLPLKLLLSALGNTNEYDIRLGKLSHLRLKQENKQLIGATFSYQAEDTPLEKGKWLITGHTESLILDQWRNFAERYRQQQLTLATQSDTTELDVEIDWSFDTVDLQETVLDDVYVLAYRKTDHWEIGINNTHVASTLSLFDDKRTTKLHVERLTWPITETAAQDPINTHIDPYISRWTEMDLSAVPPIDVAIDQLMFSGKNLGQWTFKLRPINDGKGIELKDLYGKIEGLSFTGNNSTNGGYFRWDQHIDGNEHGQSTLAGVLTGGDIKPLLDQWQLSSLESKKSHLAIELAWPGSPDMFTLNQLIGDITIDINDGRFIKVQNQEATDLLRLFGLFNFDTWARRLRLDFSDLYKVGLSFDQLTGRLEIDEGIIYLTRPLVVTGPSSDLKMAGTIDYENQLIDTSLVATLPVGGNLTVGVALAAGLPAAAGVYIISKLFEDQVDKVASVSYTIKGDWEDPEIRFDKLFDEKAAEEAGETVKQQQ